MNKESLLLFINKYYLGGSIEQATWLITKNSVSTRLFNNNGLLGEVSMETDAFAKYDGVSLPVYTVSEFTKLLTLFPAEFDVTVELVGNLPKSIDINDARTQIKFPLADSTLIPKVPKKINLPDTTPMRLKFDSNFIDTFIRAKSAISSEITQFTLNVTAKKAEITFGNTQRNDTNIIITCEAESYVPMKKAFNLNNLKEVLSANKDAKSSTVDVYADGIIVLSFTGENWNTKYYIGSEKDKE